MVFNDGYSTRPFANFSIGPLFRYWDSASECPVCRILKIYFCQPTRRTFSLKLVLVRVQKYVSNQVAEIAARCNAISSRRFDSLDSVKTDGMKSTPYDVGSSETATSYEFNDHGSERSQRLFKAVSYTGEVSQASERLEGKSSRAGEETSL